MRKYVLVIVFFCSWELLSAQTSTVRTMDFHVLNSKPDSTIAADSVELVVSFKIDRSDLSSKAHIYFGSQKDSSDVASIESSFISQAGKNYTSYKGTLNEIIGYKAVVVVRISTQQFSSFHDATLFIEDTGGLVTTRFYWNKN